MTIKLAPHRERSDRLPGWLWWAFWLLFVATLIRVDSVVDPNRPGVIGWMAMAGTLIGTLALGLMVLPRRRALSQRDRDFLFEMMLELPKESDARRALIDEARCLAMRSRESLIDGMSDRPWALASLKDEYGAADDEAAEIIARDHAVGALDRRAAP